MTGKKEKLMALLELVKDTAKNLHYKVKIMEICGTHTMAIGKSGLRKVLPKNLKLISGPGCPVCVTHDVEIDAFLNLAKERNVIIATFGDLLRVPGTNGSLTTARGEGAEVEVVYSSLDALKLARKYPKKEVVFLGVGFETTAPTIALSIIQAKKENLKNFSVFSIHKLVPPVLKTLLNDSSVDLDGFLCPGHVSTIIGCSPYEFVAKEHKKACVITGFEVYDILQGLIMLLTQIKENSPKVEIQYKRGVNPQGNLVARKVISEVFKISDAWWRGFGLIENSGLIINEEFKEYDAVQKFGINIKDYYTRPKKHCSCGDILKGIKTPKDCTLFRNGCTPINPVGPCMVSSEGACAAYYRYEF